MHSFIRSKAVFMTVVLTLALGAGLVAAPLLSIDVDDRTAADTATPNTVPGYSSFTIDGTTASDDTATRVFGDYTVTFTVFDDHQDENPSTAGLQDTPGAMDDRDRSTPSNSPALAQIYDDFIFVGNSAGPTGGLDISISGGALLPYTFYKVSLFSFDSGAWATGATTRSTAWTDANTGQLVTTTTWVDDVLPATDDQYKFTGLARTDADGIIKISGRRGLPDGTDLALNNGPTVYVNGLELDVVPEPASLSVLGVGLLSILLNRRRR